MRLHGPRKKTQGLSTLGDTNSRMHRACIKQHEPAERQAFKLDSAVSRLTMGGMTGGTKNTAFPETRSLITGGSLTSMTGAAKPDDGATSRPSGANAGSSVVPPGPPKEQPPGLTPRDAGNGTDAAVDPTRLLMMGMGAGNKLQVPKNGLLWHSSHNG